MRTIKFRARLEESGKMVTFGLCDVNFDGWIDEYEDGIVEDSLAQLVGLDRNGAEVYEGDKIRNPIDGTTFRAAMNHIYTVKVYELLEAAKCD